MRVEADRTRRPGPTPARSALVAAFERLASVVGSDEDTASMAIETARLSASVRTRAPAAAGPGAGRLGDLQRRGQRRLREPRRSARWRRSMPGMAPRRWAIWPASSGTGDAQAWRAAELARALLARRAWRACSRRPTRTACRRAWFALPAVRAATGWNEWEGAEYISAEAWDQFVDAVAEREMLLDLSGCQRPRRRAAPACGRGGLSSLDGAGDSDAR